MNRDSKCNNRERLRFMNMMAEKDAERERVIMQKNEEIEYWKRAAEQAIKSRHRALYSHATKVKQWLEWAYVCLMWGAGLAVFTAIIIGFWTWANQ
jgi:hypothetical protein